MLPVICQKWEESERGWGQRPDGYSLHLTEEDRVAYIKAYWEVMPSDVPDEYSRPCGDPFVCEVDKDTAEQLVFMNGIRYAETPPNDPKISGWCTI